MQGLSASGLDATVRRVRALRPVCGPTAMRWIESPAFATEPHQLFMPAGIALDAQESVFEAPAFQVRLELFFDEVGE